MMQPSGQPHRATTFVDHGKTFISGLWDHPDVRERSLSNNSSTRAVSLVIEGRAFFFLFDVPVLVRGRMVPVIIVAILG